MDFNQSLFTINASKYYCRLHSGGRGASLLSTVAKCISWYIAVLFCLRCRRVILVENWDTAVLFWSLSGGFGGERGSWHGRVGSHVNPWCSSRDIGHRSGNVVWCQSVTNDVLFWLSVSPHQLHRFHDILPSMPCSHLWGTDTLSTTVVFQNSLTTTFACLILAHFCGSFIITLYSSFFWRLLYCKVILCSSFC